MKNAIISFFVTLLITTVCSFLDEITGREVRALGLLDVIILYFLIDIKLNLSEKEDK